MGHDGPWADMGDHRPEYHEGPQGVMRGHEGPHGDAGGSGGSKVGAAGPSVFHVCRFYW
jgi:hypothetical protein